MRIVKFIALCTLIAVVGCRSSKTVATVAPQLQPSEITASPTMDSIQAKGNPPPKENPASNYSAEPVMVGFNNSNNLQENEEKKPLAQTETETSKTDSSASFENNQSENIQSFAQVKQMVADKQITLSKKQLKRIDKLESKYHGDFNKFRDDTTGIFDTQTSKIIAAVGVVGLLLLIVSGSGFGAFLLILSVGALLLKWLHIISF